MDKNTIPVIPEMVLSSEGFTTDVTRIGSFISVSSLVDQQVVGFSEMTTTKPTDVLFLCS